MRLYKDKNQENLFIVTVRDDIDEEYYDYIGEDEVIDPNNEMEDVFNAVFTLAEIDPGTSIGISFI